MALGLRPSTRRPAPERAHGAPSPVRLGRPILVGPQSLLSPPYVGGCLLARRPPPALVAPNYMLSPQYLLAPVVLANRRLLAPSAYAPPEPFGAQYVGNCSWLKEQRRWLPVLVGHPLLLGPKYLLAPVSFSPAHFGPAPHLTVATAGSKGQRRRPQYFMLAALDLQCLLAPVHGFATGGSKGGAVSPQRLMATGSSWPPELSGGQTYWGPAGHTWESTSLLFRASACNH